MSFSEKFTTSIVSSYNNQFTVEELEKFDLQFVQSLVDKLINSGITVPNFDGSDRYDMSSDNILDETGEKYFSRRCFHSTTMEMIIDPEKSSQILEPGNGMSFKDYLRSRIGGYFVLNNYVRSEIYTTNGNATFNARR